MKHFLKATNSVYSSPKMAKMMTHKTTVVSWYPVPINAEKNML